MFSLRLARLPRWARAPGAIALTALVSAGCVTAESVRYGEVVSIPGAYAPLPAPLSIGEIAAELRAGRLQPDLAADVRARGLLAPARSADIDLLLRHGAGSELIDAVRDETDEMLRAVVPVPAPVTVAPGYYHDYGWYPWVPFTFGLWWYGGAHHRHPGPAIRPYRSPPPGRPAPGRLPAPVKPSR